MESGKTRIIYNHFNYLLKLKCLQINIVYQTDTLIVLQGLVSLYQLQRSHFHHYPRKRLVCLEPVPENLLHPI